MLVLLPGAVEIDGDQNYHALNRRLEGRRNAEQIHQIVEHAQNNHPDNRPGYRDILNLIWRNRENIPVKDREIGPLAGFYCARLSFPVPGNGCPGSVFSGRTPCPTRVANLNEHFS